MTNTIYLHCTLATILYIMINFNKYHMKRRINIHIHSQIIAVYLPHWYSSQLFYFLLLFQFYFSY